MKLSKVLDLRGTKIAYLMLAMAGNVAMALLFFSLVDSLVARYGDLVTGLDTTLMLGIFLGSLTVAFLVAVLAKDKRGLTYGVYGGLAGMIVIGLMTWKSGLLSALVSLMAVFGGFQRRFAGRNVPAHSQTKIAGSIKLVLAWNWLAARAFACPQSPGVRQERHAWQCGHPNGTLQFRSTLIAHAPSRRQSPGRQAGQG